MTTAVRGGRGATIVSGLVGVLAACSTPSNDTQSRVAQPPAAAGEDASCGATATRCLGDDAAAPALDATLATESDAAVQSMNAADGSLDFTSCTMDSECIAVPEVGCCGPGAWVAVNRSRVDAYQAYATCAELRPMCPMISLAGDRVAECDNGTFNCTMIVASRIACGGFIRNQHRCPDGYACNRRGRVPDIPGSCVAITDSGAD
jgi:hypothetical protein